MDAQGLRRAGKGDGDGHAPDALRPVGQIEHSGADRAGNLCPSLLGLFSLEAHHGLTVHDAEDVRTGVGDDGRQGLLVEEGGVQHGIITVEMGCVQFQLHSIPLLVLLRAAGRAGHIPSHACT